MGRSLKGEVRTRWPRNAVYKEFIQVDGTGTASIIKGGQYVTLADNGTGDYTLTLTYPGAQLLGATVTIIGATMATGQIAAVSPSAVNVLTFDDAGSAADADFFVELTLTLSQYEF